MSSYNSGGQKTFVTGGAVPAFAHVKIDTGAVVVAGAGEAGIGFAMASAASGDPVAVQVGRPTVKAIAAAAISAGAAVYAAASGEVSTSANGNAIGLALTAAGADGDIIEVLPYIANFATPNTVVVEAKTANFNVAAGDSGKSYTNTGASGTITASLPAATIGLQYDFFVGAAQVFRIDPNGTETIALHTGVQQAAGLFIHNNVVGSFFRARCVIAGQWNVVGSLGTWVVEA